jgi:hypothetical protein
MLYETLQKLLSTSELRTPELDNRNRQLFHLPTQMVVREAFIADREVSVDSFAWDAMRKQRRLER